MGLLACVLIPHLPLWVELARRPPLADADVLIAARGGREALVLDWQLGAASSSSSPSSPSSPSSASAEPLAGWPLARARSRLPQAAVLEADADAYAAAFERVLTALEAVSDRVEAAALGTAYVGLSGLAEMHGGEASLHQALREAPLAALPTRPPGAAGAIGIGVAKTKFTAWAAARQGAFVQAPSDAAGAAAFLAPLSVDLLGPVLEELEQDEAAFLADVHRLGWHRLGEVAAQDRDQLSDRFGRAGRLAGELARGLDPRPLRPRRAAEELTESLTLPAPAPAAAVWRAAVEALLPRLFAPSRLQGRSVGSANLVCRLADPDLPAWQRRVHFKPPVSGWRAAAGIIGRRLEAALEQERPGAPLAAVRLTLGGLSAAGGRQLSLFPDVRADREQRLAAAERQLRAQFGAPVLHRLIAAAPHHPAPELRTLQLPLNPAAEAEKGTGNGTERTKGTSSAPSRKHRKRSRERSSERSGEWGSERGGEGGGKRGGEWGSERGGEQGGNRSGEWGGEWGGGEQLRPLAVPAAVRVREGPNQEPLAVQQGRGWQPVEAIEERWRFDLWWRPARLHRHYYRVRHPSGHITLYRDQQAAQWYRQPA